MAFYHITLNQFDRESLSVGDDLEMFRVAETVVGSVI